MPFFRDQVRVLRQLGVDCHVVHYPSGDRNANRHTDSTGPLSTVLNRIYGHNPAYYAYRGATFYPKILRRSLRTEFDLVHINSGMVGPLGLLQPQRPVVLTLWGDDLLGDRLYGYQSKLTRQCAMRSDAVIVRSPEMVEALPCPAHILPSGVDTTKFRPADHGDALEEVGWDPEAMHVIFPYPKTARKKRYQVAVDTVAEVDKRTDPPVKLQPVYGVPHDELYWYYNAADALLLPSLREGSPNTVKEAMACNLPVVSTDVGDVRERLGPVDNSYVCSQDSELVDALLSVLESGERSDGREYVEEVSLERMGERILDIYESLIEKSRTSSKRTI